MRNWDWFTEVVVYPGPQGYLGIAVLGCFLLSFLIQGSLGEWLRGAGKYLSLGLSLTASIISMLMVVNFCTWDVTDTSSPPGHLVQVQWFAVKGLSIKAGILVNGVSVAMLALVTFITFLVHLFSLEYMKNDPRLPRYWALLGLFAFSICGVVLADNLFLIFVFWELVGFCSYLLIGFWFEDPASGPASQKAFIVNRIGDLGFIIALMLMFAGGVDFGLAEASLAVRPMAESTFNTIEEINTTWIGFFLLLGILGKSAQFPLQIWLPDAMVGPTPVSSLLHAATMVAAGVYLLIRIGFLFTEPVLDLMAWIGGFTALIAAISALTQNDIKGVLAYSTISQLGFMVMAVGVGSTFYAYFHLITHAFFKCGLFLAAGAVVHQLHTVQNGQEQHFNVKDIRLMGGLAKKMPFTAGAYLVFAGALAGLPLFSGFISKDGILIGAIEYGLSEGGVAWGPAVFGLIASVLTAFYITRHGLLIFFGKQRFPGPVLPEIRPANWTMRIPLLLLAIGSLGLIKYFLKPVFNTSSFQLLPHPAHGSLPETALMATFVALAVTGVGAAYWMWRSGNLGKQERTSEGILFRLSKNHFYLDQAYERRISKPLIYFAGLLARFDKHIVDGAVNRVASTVVRKDEGWSLSKASAWFDVNIVDGIVNRIAAVVLSFGQRVRKLQGGNLQRYILYALLGLLLLLGALIYLA